MWRRLRTSGRHVREDWPSTAEGAWEPAVALSAWGEQENDLGAFQKREGCHGDSFTDTHVVTS
jgi:hypothetical protein